MLSNYSDEKGAQQKNADLLDGFKSPAAEHVDEDESPKTGLLLFSFGGYGGFSKTGDGNRSSNAS